MARSFLILIAMFTLAICNLHPPSMLHADEADHHAHAAQPGSRSADAADDLVGDPAAEGDPDADHGIAPAGDHNHTPSALAVADVGFEKLLAERDVVHNGGSAAVLLSWATAPPTEPPSA